MVSDMTTGNVVESVGLDAAALAAIERLEAACAGDGRLKLEYPTLRRRPAGQVNDVFFVEDGEVVGFAGLYRFGFGPIEVTGMVHPRCRRRGIGRQLLAAVLALRGAQDERLVLLLGDRRSAAGAAFAVAAAGVPHHSEHFLTLREPPAAGGRDVGGTGGLTMRPATPEDSPFVERLVREEFGLPGDSATTAPASEPDRGTRIFEYGGERVGVIRNEHEADGSGYIAGFVVDAEYRGRGFGRTGLRLAVSELRNAGARPISLEVETTNDRALGIYLDAGFEPVSTMDYWALPSGAAHR